MSVVGAFAIAVSLLVTATKGYSGDQTYPIQDIARDTAVWQDPALAP
jgi:hypothetical protein